VRWGYYGAIELTYAQEVGERLRRVRVEQGLTLQDVERVSNGAWKAAVVGSYERGDRNISASRLLELAEFYGISPADVLPGESRRSVEASAGVVLNLDQLHRLGDGFAALRRYCESIQMQRGDFNRRVLSVRGDDLRALAVIQDCSSDELIEQLEEVGALLQDGQV
jgi:transcriptional regulator with XRE-family HTH domain